MISADMAPTMTPQRPVDDGMGNDGYADLTPTPMIVDLAAGVRDREARGVSIAQAGTVFVPRTYDLRAGDKITTADGSFIVTGKAQGNMDHPMTGADLGWKWFSLSGGR